MFSAVYMYIFIKVHLHAWLPIKFICFFIIDENKKLDSCVLVAVLGFESMDGSITDSQFVYDEEE